MSIRLMAQVFDNETLGPTERLILLALADHADDEGKCYPSIARLCRRTGLKERSIQSNIRNLQKQGYLTIKERAGQGGSNLYFVNTTPAADAPRTKCTPAADAPRTKCTPAADAPPPRIRCGSNPAADAPKPPVTIIEPSEVPPLVPPAEKPPPRVHLPQGWTPSDEDWEYARKQNLTDEEIKEIADDFQGYWSERRDAKAKRTQDGWRRTWQGQCRRAAPSYIRNRNLARQSGPHGYGQGGSVASIVARRQAQRQV